MRISSLARRLVLAAAFHPLIQRSRGRARAGMAAGHRAGGGCGRRKFAAGWLVNKHPPPPAAPPRRIISEREVQRFIRFEVALIKCKRRQRKLSVEKCAGWVGLTPRGWRKVEHRKSSPTERTLVLMMVAVNLTLAEIVVAMQRRKTKHLRAIAGSEQLFQF